jgi:hypothetical protein
MPSSQPNILPPYERRPLECAATELGGLARGILTARSPEWHDRTPIEAIAASWEEREAALYGDHSLALPLSPRTADRVRAVSAHLDGCSVRLQEIQLYAGDPDELPGEGVFKERATTERTVVSINATLQSQENIYLLVQSGGGLYAIVAETPFAMIDRGEIRLMHDYFRPADAAAIPGALLGAIRIVDGLLRRASHLEFFQNLSGDWSEWSELSPGLTNTLGTASSEVQCRALSSFSLPPREAYLPSELKDGRT